MATNSGERGDLNDEANFPTQTGQGRESCPTPEVLQRVAAKSLPFDNPAVQHVGLCDFCLADVNRMRHARRRRRAMVAGGLVATLLIVFGFLTNRRENWPTRAPAPQVATLDLRPFATLREDSAMPSSPTPALPRENLRLSVVLPLGSETGQYEIRLMNDQLNVIQETTGHAVFQGQETRLSAHLNLSGLKAGPYRLWIRRQSRSWRNFPLDIK